MSTPTPTPKPTIPASLADAHVLLVAHNPPSIAALILTEKLPKPLALHPTPTTSTPTARDLRRAPKPTNTNRIKPLTAREKRALAVHALPKDLKHATFAPLRELWTGYARGLAMSGSTVMAQRLAGADLHGAVVEIVRSRAVDRVGIRGTVVKETRGVVVIVTERDAVKSVPKEFTVFRVVVDMGGEKGKGKDMVFDLHGSQLMFRAAERAGRKYKGKPMLDL
ncbi:Rof/RNase P-like protein [Tricharina praecox]|uniref:Rof/RNase P-like protein n=1 Tax=Tricharina praecox TaxID=43433 RepID=UPI0022204066|nr:Rof/RNase P-like protein [Tricharina praecox]KAI5848279.1 Rof/RNase P-like protein [Tricharina praecox]